ncbi:hypothetical protein FCM35_KLT06765 [Carex littledalei]|uniref:EF-hand domain-containing protein n=1 Tax=Carex littledalei TaxID=544730 RepID=A0A833R1J3_9POAL|nr:hypothetical protein FCM35_KLT06765 [Carex littledalei]
MQFLLDRSIYDEITPENWAWNLYPDRLSFSSLLTKNLFFSSACERKKKSPHPLCPDPALSSTTPFVSLSPPSHPAPPLTRAPPAAFSIVDPYATRSPLCNRAPHLTRSCPILVLSSVALNTSVTPPILALTSLCRSSPSQSIFERFDRDRSGKIDSSDLMSSFNIATCAMTISKLAREPDTVYTGKETKQECYSN